MTLFLRSGGISDKKYELRIDYCNGIRKTHADAK
jgi:hypothetical protein